MATGLDSQTATRLPLLPALVRIAGRSVGPTRGGVTITRTENIRTPEADGVDQEVLGFAYKVSDTVQVEFVALENSAENIALAFNNAAPTGTTPNFTWTPFANKQMMAAGQYMASPGLEIYVPASDQAGFYKFTMPSGRISAQFDWAGASGSEGTIRYTITSVVAASSPDAIPYTWSRVAALPSETGGP